MIGDEPPAEDAKENKERAEEGEGVIGDGGTPNDLRVSGDGDGDDDGEG